MKYTKRRKVLGVGINDADYTVTSTVDGRRVTCPFYERWKGILRRCYDPVWVARNPSYIGCSVCDSWLTFSNFKAWMEKQDWVGNEIDKDLLIPSNKVYSPEACVFVSQRTNKVLLDCRSAQGKFPVGVSRDKTRYRAECQLESGRVYLGSFGAPAAAHEAWQWAKAGVLWATAKQQTNPRVAAALELRAGRLVDDALAGRESIGQL